jgi:hypothetical protein
VKDIILEQINPFIQPQSFIILGFISTIFSGALLPLVGLFVPRVLFALAEFQFRYRVCETYIGAILKTIDWDNYHINVYYSFSDRFNILMRSCLVYYDPD